ncbi:MAG: long-chain-fatty-acid--CoA ligase [Thermaerobacter sp.]|nr:long-chain-fatty-acid--CoA ligase [Thermaerobacter sp.]
MIVPVSPLEFGRRAFKLYGSRLAVVDGPYRATYTELAERVYRLASQIQRSVGPGDRVAILAPNSHEMLEAFYGVPWGGAVLVPLNTRLSAEDYAYILNHSGSRLLIVDHRLLDLVSPALDSLPELPVVVVGAAGSGRADYEAWLAEGDPTPHPYPLDDENRMITLNYTSGTTSRPKGVMLTHRNTFLNALQFIIHLRLEMGDSYLHTLPMFHVNGWGDVWAVSAMGAVQVCLARVEGEVMWHLIEQERVSVLCGAPAVLNMLASTPHAPPARPLRIATAGAPPPASLIARLAAEEIDILHVYGLTEVSPWITVSEVWPEERRLPAAQRAAKMACQGVEQLLAGEVKVVRPDGSPVRWDGQELGEIVNRGNLVMEGYFQQPEATAEAISDGWFHTGDLAVVHPDGYIQIRDRAKDIIISGGENISSVEVEDVLYRHPAIYEAAVVAVPDPKWGETPKAFLVVKPGETVSEDEIRQFCREHLAHFKVPTSFEMISGLPRTASGKVQKYVLRQPYWANQPNQVN